jgi:hypothetical protein
MKIGRNEIQKKLLRKSQLGRQEDGGQHYNESSGDTL